MSRGRVWVELLDGRIIRVFKNVSQATLSESWPNNVKEYPRKDAVGEIRKRVFARANNECERCGKNLSPGQGHMDEKISRGEGGEISMSNCWELCYNCHIGRPDAEHGNRRLMFGK